VGTKVPSVSKVVAVNCLGYEWWELAYITYGVNGNAYGVTVGKPVGQNDLKDLASRGDSITMRLTEIGWHGGCWINQAQDSDIWWAHECNEPWIP
jgi:hypothetical protein